MMDEPIEKINREEMAVAIKAMKPGKTDRPSTVCTEIISTSEKVGISVMLELCQRVLDGK